jgi:hypothetical protein
VKYSKKRSLAKLRVRLSRRTTSPFEATINVTNPATTKTIIKTEYNFTAGSNSLLADIIELTCDEIDALPKPKSIYKSNNAYNRILLL